jgi:hypothetical protein
MFDVELSEDCSKLRALSGVEYWLWRRTQFGRLFASALQMQREDRRDSDGASRSPCQAIAPADACALPRTVHRNASHDLAR